MKILLKARLFRRVLTATSRGVVEVANFHKHQKHFTYIQTYTYIFLYIGLFVVAWSMDCCIYFISIP